MEFLVCIGALCFLMFVAYRGFSVILFAPIAALGAVLFTNPVDVLPAYSHIFQEKMVVFAKLYFPAFVLGAIFGKVIEMSGFARSIVASVIKIVGAQRGIVSIVVVCCLLTYGGVSLFVVVFAVYPFAAEMFRQTNIPKRLIPGTIALGAFTITMDSLPGTPQIQNIIPTTFFKTDAYAAPILGTVGAIFIMVIGLTYLQWRARSAQAAGEGYGTGHINEPDVPEEVHVNPVLAISPLFVVGIANLVFTRWVLPGVYGTTHTFQLSAIDKPIVVAVKSILGIWSIEVSLLLGILLVIAASFKTIASNFSDGSKSAIGGALLATMNTASEYGFGSVISSLPGFILVCDALTAIPNPLINEAITVNVLAGVTGSASGGMSIALAAMSQQFIEAANAHNIPLEVLHRVASMASGGMDTLPHNGAVITLLAITGLTHKTSYKDIFAITCTKTLAVFFIIAFYYATGLV
ncbi:MAG: GntP family permease [Mycobacterium sp.]|nr:GntP family permease [Mycobacterium sp.]